VYEGLPLTPLCSQISPQAFRRVLSSPVGRGACTGLSPSPLPLITSPNFPQFPRKRVERRVQKRGWQGNKKRQGPSSQWASPASPALSLHPLPLLPAPPSFTLQTLQLSLLGQPARQAGRQPRLGMRQERLIIAPPPSTPPPQDVSDCQKR